MDRKEIDTALERVIREANAIGIFPAENLSRSVLVNSRPKKRFGCCRKKDGYYTIEISEFILNCENKKIRAVLAHELLHTCQGAFEHGKIWKNYAERMNDSYGYNIKRVLSFEDMGLPQEEEKDRSRYLLKCRRCGREYKRTRRSRLVRESRNYRCRCGGKLNLVNIDFLIQRGENMERNVGTVSRGIRGPIIREGDKIADIVVDSVLRASSTDGFEIRDRDIICVTESVVARSQGNYANVDAIAGDVKAKLGGGTVGVIFPILSRNRFAICLKGMARGAEKIVLMLSYPSDEVGNALITMDQVDEAGINPYSDLLDLKKYRELFGENKHQFTGVDYVQYYSDLIKGEGAEVEVIFANHPEEILNYTKNVITCDIHTRERTKRILREKGANIVLGMDDILTESVDGSGFNTRFGLLGSNKATEDTIKLFPNECKDIVLDIQKQIFDKTGSKVEVMVYGDGAFKDPVGKIWELADPKVGVAYTDGLEGTPNELKLKYLADNDFAELKGDELKQAIENRIKEKDGSLVGKMESEGTTPRQLTDLIGSLCDLTSGSGDKGTPIIHIQGYFDNYTSR